MDILIQIVFGVIGWVFGVFAFSQIIGGIRARSHYFTVVLWTILTLSLSLAIVNFAPDRMIAYFIGLAVSLIQVLSVGRIE